MPNAVPPRLLTLGWTFVVSDAVVDIVAAGFDAGACFPPIRRSAGYYSYYPHRRHVSPVLRALIDHLRPQRAGRTRKRPRLRPSP